MIVWENLKYCSMETFAPVGSYSHFNFSFSQTSTHASTIVWKQGKCFLFLNLKMKCINLKLLNVPFSYYTVAQISYYA